jgi:hypothetical protein
MTADKLGRLTRKTYLLELALAGLETHAGHSSPTDPQRHYEPVRELADEIYTALHDELEAELDEDEITRRLKG